MILLQNLHKAKDYKEETLHLAGSLADRFLASISQRSLEGKEAVDIVALATICLLLAAKLE